MGSHPDLNTVIIGIVLSIEISGDCQETVMDSYYKLPAKQALSLTFCSLLLLSACGGGGGPQTGISGLNRGKIEDVKQPVLTDSVEGRDDPIASAVAVKYAGLSKSTPDGFWYADLKKATAPTKSFGVYSKTSNLKMIFLVFDDNTAVSMLPNFAGKPPYTEVAGLINRVEDSKGEEDLRSGDKFKWILSEYPKRPEGKTDFFRALVGGFPSTEEGKSILVVARAYDQDVAFNHRHALFIIDTLMKEREKKEEPREEVKKEEPKKDLTSQEEIDKFMEQATASVNENLSLPDKVAKANKKYQEKNGKVKKWTDTHLEVGIDSEGKLKSLGDKTRVPTEENKLVVKALIEAVQAVGKFADAPVVESDEFQFTVRLKGDKAVLKRVGEEKY